MAALDSKIAVLGAGSWGTAMAHLFSSNELDVTLWAKRADLANEIRSTRSNTSYLPEISLSEHLKVTSNLADIAHAPLIVGAVPSFAMHGLLRELASLTDFDSTNSVWVNLTKGIEYLPETQRLKSMSELVREELRLKDVLSLSGPSFAVEVALGSPTTVVLAGHDHLVVEEIQKLFSCDRFRVYASDDLIGVELGGVFKNIIAISAGISDGLGFGENAKGALISRGLVEMTRLGTHLGASKETFFGLAGLGDMVISAMSGKSRNQRVGQRIGAGESLNEILNSMDMVAEGIYAVKAIHSYAKAAQIDLPITSAVYDVLYENAKPLQKLSELMAREPKREDI